MVLGFSEKNGRKEGRKLGRVMRCTDQARLSFSCAVRLFLGRGRRGWVGWSEPYVVLNEMELRARRGWWWDSCSNSLPFLLLFFSIGWRRSSRRTRETDRLRFYTTIGVGLVAHRWRPVLPLGVVHSPAEGKQSHKRVNSTLTTLSKTTGSMVTAYPSSLP